MIVFAAYKLIYALLSLIMAGFGAREHILLFTVKRETRDQMYVYID